MSDQEIFNAAYRLSKPHEVQNLLAMPADSVQAIHARTQKAVELALQGFLIDADIDAAGYDPWLVMNIRKNAGFLWYTSLLTTGSVPYTTDGPLTHLPAGPKSIRISIDPGDYPPFDTPLPNTPPANPADPVGPQMVGNLYQSTGTIYPDGYKYTSPRGGFVFHFVATPFGHNAYWEKVG